MAELWESIKHILSPQTIIEYGGLLLVCIVVFTENGIFFGFFLAGDSLILTTGILTATGLISQPIAVVEIALILSAILGYMAGYWFGSYTGKALYRRKDSLFFKKSYVHSAEDYYKRYGGSTLIIGRFLPVIRTFAPIVAGVIKMRLATFMVYNIAGSVLWITSLASIGYFLGMRYKDTILNYLGYIVIALVVVTAIPIVRLFIKRRKNAGK